MISRKQFKYVIIFWISLLVVAAMSIIMSLIKTGTVPFPGILKKIGVGFVVAYVASLMVPTVKWANGFALACKAKPGTVAYSLLENVIHTLFFGTLLTFVFTAMAIGFPAHYLTVCIHELPLGLFIGYIVGYIMSPIALKLTHLMCTKP